MKLAILMTNTDVSAFANNHPKDGEKFISLIASVRPDWNCNVYNTTQRDLPKNIKDYDGFIVTGSPASVHDNTDWISDLSDLVVNIHRHGLAIFGACFGHQLIATALGGRVERNPHGWVLGLAESDIVKNSPWTKDLPKRFPLYAAHIEQVVDLPKRAQVVASSKGCPTAGFVIGNAVYTTQYHPEMTPDFIESLVEYLSESLNKDVIEKARSLLSTRVEMTLFAESIAKFFENSIQ